MINKTMPLEYNIHEFAKIIGMTDKTLRRWDKSGRLKAYRRESGEYYYTEEQAAQYADKSCAIVCPHCQGKISIIPVRLDKA